MAMGNDVEVMWTNSILSETTESELQETLGQIEAVIRMRAMVAGFDDIPVLQLEDGPYIYVIGNPDVTDCDDNGNVFTRPNVCVELQPLNGTTEKNTGSMIYKFTQAYRMMPIPMLWLLARIKVTDRFLP